MWPPCWGRLMVERERNEWPNGYCEEEEEDKYANEADQQDARSNAIEALIDKSLKRAYRDCGPDLSRLTGFIDSREVRARCLLTKMWGELLTEQQLDESLAGASCSGANGKPKMPLNMNNPR